MSYLRCYNLQIIIGKTVVEKRGGGERERERESVWKIENLIDGSVAYRDEIVE